MNPALQNELDCHALAKVEPTDRTDQVLARAAILVYRSHLAQLPQFEGVNRSISII